MDETAVSCYSVGRSVMAKKFTPEKQVTFPQYCRMMKRRGNFLFVENGKENENLKNVFEHFVRFTRTREASVREWDSLYKNAVRESSVISASFSDVKSRS
ncbi:MAG: hypothetical protein A3H57_03555 [Candidatus Taylorbacteria bacterium RIFCSPLOWO2_02_FULL_43_11]|uniref:Uncharacterized protein n=1 Tax=Candidatus Taylorbacteria bacterium RIFCSPHIGHO2_02_FULL_43_32b TaxID=1802306 RepID=A0A1G2MKI4_9BACT|nr:MAG: hypothetical protein A3C72_02210 [Candidatus Taylorbacteria bacterium RIFCSPHIGHO2_02_FULL_43_32b]OHA31710.1 MAG: hypothetical protein A3B08_01935 [Candidatus Taylorbacteria bacterium RIFCSPLOWO2_01_FULL_43_44]OHA36623.1 MAG: hypothetical protein A3H57_03555 [Candidatus Taylorbacteria bacterium RIFCSPLOWO2_02_FULL_43_11]